MADQLTLSINPLIPVFSQVWPEGFQSILTEVNREVSALFPLMYKQHGRDGPSNLVTWFKRNGVPFNASQAVLALEKQFSIHNLFVLELYIMGV